MKKRTLTTILFFSLLLPVFAQLITVRGTVSEKKIKRTDRFRLNIEPVKNNYVVVDGKIKNIKTDWGDDRNTYETEPIYCAGVSVKRTGKHTITDHSGKYSIEASIGDTLLISNPFYKDQPFVIKDSVCDIIFKSLPDYNFPSTLSGNSAVYIPFQISIKGQITDELGDPIANVNIMHLPEEYETDEDDSFVLLVSKDNVISFSKDFYKPARIDIKGIQCHSVGNYYTVTILVNHSETIDYDVYFLERDYHKNSLISIVLQPNTNFNQPDDELECIPDSNNYEYIKPLHMRKAEFELVKGKYRILKF